MFLLPQQEAGRYGLALADVNDGIRSLDGVIGLIGNIAERPGGVTGQRVKETINRWSRSIGGPDYFKSEELGTNIPLEEAEAIKARVIAQYKRFLSQETGNGISEGDVNRLADALGKLDWFGNPDAAIARIKETQGIFQARKDKIVNEIEQFDNKAMYRNEKAYNDTMRSLVDQVNRAYSVFGEDMADQGVSGRNALISDLFNISEVDGITTYSLKTS